MPDTQAVGGGSTANNSNNNFSANPNNNFYPGNTNQASGQVNSSAYPGFSGVNGASTPSYLPSQNAPSFPPRIPNPVGPQPQIQPGQMVQPQASGATTYPNPAYNNNPSQTPRPPVQMAYSQNGNSNGNYTSSAQTPGPIPQNLPPRINTGTNPQTNSQLQTASTGNTSFNWASNTAPQTPPQNGNIPGQNPNLNTGASHLEALSHMKPGNPNTFPSNNPAPVLPTQNLPQPPLSPVANGPVNISTPSVLNIDQLSGTESLKAGESFAGAYSAQASNQNTPQTQTFNTQNLNNKGPYGGYPGQFQSLQNSNLQTPGLQNQQTPVSNYQNTFPVSNTGPALNSNNLTTSNQGLAGRLKNTFREQKGGNRILLILGVVVVIGLLIASAVLFYINSTRKDEKKTTETTEQNTESTTTTTIDKNNTNLAQLNEVTGGTDTPATLSRQFNASTVPSSWLLQKFVNPDVNTSGSCVNSTKCGDNADPDQDGVINIDEYNFRLDPLDSDTDNDGVSDGNELYIYYSDANKADSDGDNLQDGAELIRCLDPISAQNSSAKMTNERLSKIETKASLKRVNQETEKTLVSSGATADDLIKGYITASCASLSSGTNSTPATTTGGSDASKTPAKASTTSATGANPI